jgi:peptidoglycan-N-acetylglucosamine deacetylase
LSELKRRRFLGALSVAVLGGIGGMGAPRGVLGGPPHPSAAAAAAVTKPLARGGEAVASPLLSQLPPPDPIVRVALPGGGVLRKLPGNGNLLALTVDDGVNTDVVRLYTEFANETGVRLTYFVNGIYPSWTDNLALLRPLVECGQIQLGNHTWSHPNLTRVPASRVAHEIARNDGFLKNTFGVDARPYFRPPYGNHNPVVDAVAADLGYKAITMWSGSLSDSTVIPEDYIVQMAERAFTPQAIVIGHLNHPPVTHVYEQLRDVIRARNLRTVTFNDVFAQ